MIIGLTGGIGSGKSTVAKMFAVLGCVVFNSDDAAKRSYFEDETRLQVINLLGKESYISKTELNRSYISSKIFSDPALLHQLNAIIHPEVRKKFTQFVSENEGKIVVKETALLFEAGIDKEVDKIVLVAADDELRIARTMKRDGLGRGEVLSKIKSQLPQEEKIKRSDFVIYNNEKEFVITQALDIFNKIKSA
jgi:dephospho-CoA kinase